MNATGIVNRIRIHNCEILNWGRFEDPVFEDRTPHTGQLQRAEQTSSRVRWARWSIQQEVKLTSRFTPTNAIACGCDRSSHPLDPRQLGSLRLDVPRVAARRASLTNSKRRKRRISPGVDMFAVEGRRTRSSRGTLGGESWREKGKDGEEEGEGGV